MCKNQWDYWDAIHLAIRMAECKIDPVSVCCDFEKALINAVQEQFRRVPIIGCLFHWKQTIRRRMISKLKMNEDQVRAAMAPNMLDTLTIIPRDEILTKGIAYVKEQLKAHVTTEEDKSLWNDFWNGYFIKFWCSSEEFIATWNINDGGDYYDVHNRTNNVIERYLILYNFMIFNFNNMFSCFCC